MGKSFFASAGAVPVALGLLLAVAGAAWAATVQCEPGGLAEQCLGTTRADTVTGTDGDDFVRSLGGSDTVNSGRGVDTVQGGRGPDIVRGGPNDDDLVFGGEAGRQVQGPFLDAADDRVLGGAGDDQVAGGFGQGGRDEVFGGEGNDSIQTAQRGSQSQLGVKVTRERIDCGPGNDAVRFDQGLDTFVDKGACEQRFPVPPGGGTPMGARGMPDLPFE